MTLVTKVGGKESNSFVTLAQAETIIALLPDDTTEWDGLSDDEKEYRLILGANLMSSLPLKGYRSFEGQYLCFPRSAQGNQLVVPDEVKETQVFLAYSVVHRGLANRSTDITEAEGDRVTQVSLGGLLSVSFAKSKTSGTTFLDQMIMSAQFPAYARMMKWLTSFRGRSVPDADDLDLLTTTTTT